MAAATLLVVFMAPASREAAAGEILPNGLRAWSFTSGHPGRFSLAVVVRTGSRDEPDDARGISHALEHAIFLGTRELDQAQLLREFRRRGVAFNGATSSDLTSYHFDAPMEQARWLVDVTAAMIAAPALREQDVAAEIQVVLEELDGRGADIAAPGIEAALYPGHGLGVNPGGTSRTVGALDAQRLASWHERRYRAEDMVVAWAAAPGLHDELRQAVSGAFRAVQPGKAVGSRSPPQPRAGTWTDAGMGVQEDGDATEAGMLLSGHHVRGASPEIFAAMLVMERVLTDECIRSMRTERPVAYFTQVRFEAHSDARRIEFLGRVRDATKLSELAEALAVARSRAPNVDELTFAVARDAVQGTMDLPSSGAALVRIALLELKVDGPAVAEPRIARALETLTRPRMAEIAAGELAEQSAYVVSSMALLESPIPPLEMAALVLGAFTAIVVLVKLGPRTYHRLRLRALDATWALRMSLAGRKQRERMDAEIEAFLRHDDSRPHEPPDARGKRREPDRRV